MHSRFVDFKKSKKNFFGRKIFLLYFFFNSFFSLNVHYILDAVTSSGILKAKQKLGVTFNFDKQDVIDLTKISKMTMCRASEANSEK